MKKEEKSGKLTLVSVGPGTLDLIPERAQNALREAEVIVAYELYLRWVQPILRPEQRLLTPPLTQEKERALLAIEHAAAGKRVAIVSSGDIGVYAMAGLVFEALPEKPSFAVEVIPGITAATACASLLGSPLTHDFATLSLSDLLCPWEWIENRANHIAQADLACVLYNVQSKGRQEGVYKILDILLKHKSPETVCGVVRNAYREDQSRRITTLGELREGQFDMLTTLVIGNRFTRASGDWMYTPRGYFSWKDEDNESKKVITDTEKSVWVFSGTSDGNALALALAEAGYSVTISVAQDLGEALTPVHKRIRVSRVSGKESRAKALQKGASAVIDATHPYAKNITKQLYELCGELNLPYFRYERPASDLDNKKGVLVVDSLSEAAAIVGERRVFLTGIGILRSWAALPCYVPERASVRLTPQPELLAEALALGISARQITAAVGSFDTDWNEAEWRARNIDVVVCKDSGTAGGFEEKYRAAQKLGIDMIVIRRPQHSEGAFSDPETLYHALKQQLSTRLDS